MVKSQGGKVVLRIEDLDSARSKPEYVDALLRMFEETGLAYDEGPYFQSENIDAYASIYEDLSSKGMTYPCFCTRRDLAFQSAPHGSDRIRVYDRRCKGLAPEEASRRTEDLAKEGRRPAYRIETDSREISFDDLMQGHIARILDRDCGDFIVKRADEDFAYHLAVTADDIAQGVNLVSRGYDLLESTPQQIYLYQLLGKKVPEYAHFPLICAEDGRRLAKRNRDATYDSLKAYLGSPEHVIGHIAYIAGIQDDDEPATPSGLLSSFNLDGFKKDHEGMTSITYR